MNNFSSSSFFSNNKILKESDSSSSSDSDENEPPPLEKCRVCSKTQNSNQNSKPECFIKCTSCRGKGKRLFSCNIYFFK